MDKSKQNKMDFKKDNKKSPHHRGKGGKRFQDKRKDYEPPCENAPTFYTKFAKLAENVARIAWNHRNGSTIKPGYSGSITDKILDPILALETIVTPGSDDYSINTNADAMYKVLNRKFRGTYNKYQAADAGIIQFGLVDLFASIAEAERIYGTLMYYSIQRLPVPDGLLLAMNVDPISFENRLAEFRQRLNELILGAKALCLVRGYSLLDHTLYIYSNVFMDKNCDRSQLIVFNKAGFWKYDPTTLSTGSALKFKRYSSYGYISNASDNAYTVSLRTFDTILSDIKEQLDSFAQDDDVDQVCADILAYFGNPTDSADIVQLAFVPDTYAIKPVFDEEILKQVHNSVAVSKFPLMYSRGYGNTPRNLAYTRLPTAEGINTPELYVWQEKNQIRFDLNILNDANPTIGADGTFRVFGTTSPTSVTYSAPIVDINVNEPTTDQVMEYTRYTSLVAHRTFDVGGTTYHYYNVNCHGSIVVTNYVFLIWGKDKPTYLDNSKHNIDGMSAPRAAIFTSNIMSSAVDLTYVTRFDWAPIMSVQPLLNIYGDLDNYIILDYDLLNPLHSVAVLSELKSPITGVLLQED